MGKFKESLKYVTLLFQIKKNRIKYVKAVIAYRLTEHPKLIIFPEMLVKLYNVKLIARKNTQDSAFLSYFYERELTRYLLDKKPKTFIDIGAHIGRFSILLAKNGSNVISIEPSSRNYKQLYKNALLNNVKINLLNIGCSDKKGIGNLSVDKKYTGQNTFLKRDNENIEKSPMSKLDNLIKEEMDDKDVIKIDVEGFELKVLNGMKRILKSQNPVIILEISSKEDKNKIDEFMNKFGYFNKTILDERNFLFKKGEVLK